MPALDGWSWGYEKFARRSEDWAMVGVCALVKASGGQVEDVRIGLTHMGSTPLRATAAEDALRGGSLDADSIAAAAEQAAEGTDPPGDLNATPDYKRHLARTLYPAGARAGGGRLSGPLSDPNAVREALASQGYLADEALARRGLSRDRPRTAAAARGRGRASARPRPRRRWRRRPARA